MTDQKAAAPEYVAPPLGKPFIEMDGSQKFTFIGKAIVMLLTGGFAFPNIFVE